MENTARLEPGFVASQFGIDACPNQGAFTHYLDGRKELGIDACAFCNGCRVSLDPNQAHCSATVIMKGRAFEGALLAQEVPELQLTFPVEVPNQLPQENDALVVELSQESADEQAA